MVGTQGPTDGLKVAAKRIILAPGSDRNLVVLLVVY
jgi:hypothetical protein